MPSREIPVTVIIDTREKQPLRFPRTLLWRPGTILSPRNRAGHTLRISSVTRTLHAGDITIRGCERLVAGECKRSLSELLKNFTTKDKRRQAPALCRFVESCRHPILFLEMLPSEFWAEHPGASTALLLDTLFGTLAASTRPIHLVIGARRSSRLSARVRLGELLLRSMLAFVSLDDLRDAARANHRTTKPRRRRTSK